MSSITFHELEEIKTSDKKDAEIKYKARNLLRLFEENEDKYVIDIVTQNNYEILDELDLPISNDNLIISGAYACMNDSVGECDIDADDISVDELFAQAKYHDSDILFVTDDIAARRIAETVGLSTEVIEDDNVEEHCGWKEFSMNNSEVSELYSNLNKNFLNLERNEYGIIKLTDVAQDGKQQASDVVKWTGTETKRVMKKTLRSKYFDKIKPKDEFQWAAVDAILSNTMTIIYGSAGSGKSLIALAAAMHLIETGEYERLVILTNCVKARGAADLGFYSGTAQEKILANSVGEMLVSKFGDRYLVDELLTQDKLKLVSMGDSRGFEVKDTELLYITESQNTSIDLMKLCLSRVSQGAKIIIEGDFNAQVDARSFEGRNNGMMRAIKALHGEELVSVVKLPNIWRSKIAELVQKM